MEITIKYGDGALSLSPKSIPSSRILRPDVPAPLATDSIASLLRRKLESPIASKPFSRIVSPGERWTIVVSDRSRRYGVPLWGPAVLDALNEGGVPDKDITILFATGTHAAQTDAERRALVGAEIASRVRLVDHLCDDACAVTLVGETRRGTPVEINRLVVEADRVLITGVVQHHYYAGFTGGRKALLPGVCSRRSVFANHSLNLHPDGGTHPAARTGVLNGNPVHEDMLDAARMVAPDFCVNVAAAGDDKIFSLFAGHYIEAHETACAWVASHYEAACDPAPVVIAGAGGEPKDASFYQAHKAFDNAFRAVAPGGTVILAARCAEGLGPDGFLEWFAMSSLETIETRLRENYVVHGHTALRALEKAGAVRAILVTDLSAEAVAKMHCERAASLDEALSMARPEIDAAGDVIIIPDANLTVPVRRNIEAD